MNKPKKVLILGSGALKIGEAGEFDYSGSQAIKALKEERIRTVLVNPNVATIQTSRDLADEVYFLPVTPYFVEKIIAREKPDGLLLSFGGQTALNCGIALHASGALKKHNVRILGTPLSAIMLTEDREKFAEHLRNIGISTPASQAAESLETALRIAKDIGFPLMVRAGFTLGGQGSGIAHNMKHLQKIAERALVFAPQILLEKYLHHYKEIEYEVVRDRKDNCITVCNMENMDPLGIHTGESIVVAPSQTLNNHEYHGLRKISIDIVRSLGIVGECNVQFALNPNPQTGDLEYYVIEVNARLSRSSALASKATGYPLAYVAAKLALGYDLTQLQNNVTGVTQACFEPALDYVVVKIPRWDLQKFKGVDQALGSSMKSVGEVMGIGRTFEEAYQKAIRMLDLDYQGATASELLPTSTDLFKSVKTPTPGRNFALAQALKRNVSVKKIAELSGIDPWFLYRIKNIVDHESALQKSKRLDKKTLRACKQLGFSDKRIGELVGKHGLDIRKLRKRWDILPAVLQIDTLASEFPAKTNYLYMTYNANHHDQTATGQKGIIVLGSGTYRIGSSVEFDWCSVNTVFGLKKHGRSSIIINCNPETVSTDYDISDRLYFEELTFERIADIYEFENPEGIIVSVGGQTANNRAKALDDYGCKVLGTSPTDIDRAEDRGKFSTLLDRLGIKQPAWQAFDTIAGAEAFAERVGYPVLIRPSYVLSGSAMNVCLDKTDLRRYIKEASKVSSEYPITVSKFFGRAQEVELDAVAQAGEIKAVIISEHIEYAGVHSGDASIVLPPDNIGSDLEARMQEIARQLARALRITGPFNIQFLVRDHDVYIIETNLRASRTFPFIAKVTGVNLITLFVDTLFKSVKPVSMKRPKGVAVKVAQFSFARLTGSHSLLGVEMGSTGEVACFGADREEAYLKGILATGGRLPQKGIFISISGNEKKQALLPTAKRLERLGLPLYATDKTRRFLAKHGIKTTRLYKIQESKAPSVIDYFQKGKIDFVINLVDKQLRHDMEDSHVMRRVAVDSNILMLTKLKQAELFVKAWSEKGLDKLAVKPWSDYL